MNSYEQKQEAKRERLEARAERLARESASAFNRSKQMVGAIPMGQPILVGHHSEGRDRRYRARAWNLMGKAVELDEAAKEAAARAAAVGSGGISSDDPDAVAKLRGELASAEANHRQMRAINAAWRKAGKPAPGDAEGWRKVADAPDVMMNPNDLLRVRAGMARDPLNRGPFPDYALSNNSANARRIKGRIAELEARAAERVGPAPDDIECDGYRVVQNVDENRLQLVFPGKPAEKVRDELKRNGFRWSPLAGAWQRQLNPNIVYHASDPAGYIRAALERALKE